MRYFHVQWSTAPLQVCHIPTGCIQMEQKIYCLSLEGQNLVLLLENI